MLCGFFDHTKCRGANWVGDPQGGKHYGCEEEGRCEEAREEKEVSEPPIRGFFLRMRFVRILFFCVHDPLPRRCSRVLIGVGGETGFDDSSVPP